MTAEIGHRRARDIQRTTAGSQWGGVDAADFAQSSPEPDPKELWTDVLVEG